MKLNVVCAWCSRYLGYKECQYPSHLPLEELVSHSICPECFQKEMAQIKTLSINKTNE